MNNPFEVLGLKGWATPDEIRTAYRALVKRCHPDMISDPAEKQAAQDRMVALNLAYEEALRLSSPHPRAATQELSSSEAVLMAQRAMARNNPESALRALVRCEHRDGEWYYMQGKVLMALEEFDSAHQSFREAVRLDPENNVFRSGALAAAVAHQKSQKLPGRVKRMFRHLVPRGLMILLLCLCLCPLTVCARAETSSDITSECRFKAGSGRKSFSQCLDRNYKTYWRSSNGEGAFIEVTLPAGKTASGVTVQWFEHPHAWGLQLKDETGKWEYAGFTEGRYLTDYLPLPEGTTHFRVTNAPEEKRHFNLTELRIWSEGELSPEVQQWQPCADKADLMLLVAHSDDEVLWFGGALPTYAGQEGKICQVCMMVPSMPYRRLELLDCLWTCGVRNYPAWSNFRDAFSATLEKQYKQWSKNRVYDVVTGWIRRFRPEVLLTHDIQGEYGHGAHRVCADAAMRCVELAANEAKYPKSAKEYGTWDTPKCYIHLYSQNVIDMDWRKPLSAFGGKTSFEVAEAGFRCHISQQVTDYHVEDWGPWDNSLFGLYRSTVGPDEAKNDFFENLN